MITEKEKHIYNSFLYASRKAKNKPVRLRQNFDSLQSEHEVALKKLSQLLSKYTHINYSDFFIAPYKVYGADNYFDLTFFNTRKAIKCYTLYCRDKQVQDPDSNESIETLRDCLKFIFNFCNERKVPLSQYKTFTEEGGALPIVFTHLKDHKINFYILHALDLEYVVKQQDEVLTWVISDFFNLYNKTRVKFVSSKLLKEKAKKGIKIIEQKLLKFSS